MFDKIRLGETIKQLRSMKGWSQSTLSGEADISIPLISQIENGRRTPYAETIIKLAGAFGVSTAEILDQFLDTPFGDEKDGCDKVFIQRYLSASPNQKKKMRAIVDVITADEAEAKEF